MQKDPVVIVSMARTPIGNLLGELKEFSRTDAENKIRELGGGFSSSVSKNTDFVVIGDNPGSKFQKAKQLGVKIIDEKEFLNMIK